MYVYLIMGTFSNGVDSWDNVEEVYQIQDDAELKALELNETNQDEYVFYSVEQFELK